MQLLLSNKGDSSGLWFSVLCDCAVPTAGEKVLIQRMAKVAGVRLGPGFGLLFSHLMSCVAFGRGSRSVLEVLRVPKAPGGVREA